MHCTEPFLQGYLNYKKTKLKVPKILFAKQIQKSKILIVAALSRHNCLMFFITKQKVVKTKNCGLVSSAPKKQRKKKKKRFIRTKRSFLPQTQVHSVVFDYRKDVTRKKENLQPHNVQWVFQVKMFYREVGMGIPQ